MPTLSSALAATAYTLGGAFLIEAISAHKSIKIRPCERDRNDETALAVRRVSLPYAQAKI